MRQIHLPRMSIEITTRCNLRCKSCAVGIPTQKEAIHLELAEVQTYLKKAFEIVDYVDSLEFTGGEPFLHRDLPEMVRSYMAYRERFGRFLIVTNGTIPLESSLLSVFKEYRECGIIHVSDYGLYPERLHHLVDLLEKNGISYRVDQYWGDNPYQGGWVDPGEVAAHGRTEEQLAETFSSCGLVRNGGCWRIHKGQLHLCERSCRCVDEGYLFPDEFIDLLDDSVSTEEKREKLYALQNKMPYLRACDYCNGSMGTKDLTKRIAAGVQIK